MSAAADQRRDRRNQLTRVDRLGDVNLLAGEQGAAAILRTGEGAVQAIDGSIWYEWPRARTSRIRS